MAAMATARIFALTAVFAMAAGLQAADYEYRFTDWSDCSDHCRHRARARVWGSDPCAGASARRRWGDARATQERRAPLGCRSITNGRRVSSLGALLGRPLHDVHELEV